MKIFIETERLILREILPTDVDGLFELDGAAIHWYKITKEDWSQSRIK